MRYYYEYLLANNYLHKVKGGNTNTICEICSKPTVKTSEQHLWLNSFLMFNRFHKERKKQSVLALPKVLRKLNKLKYALKRSRYLHIPYCTANATRSKGSSNLSVKRMLFILPFKMSVFIFGVNSYCQKDEY